MWYRYQVLPDTLRQIDRVRKIAGTARGASSLDQPARVVGTVDANFAAPALSVSNRRGACERAFRNRSGPDSEEEVGDAELPLGAPWLGEFRTAASALRATGTRIEG